MMEKQEVMSRAFGIVLWNMYENMPDEDAEYSQEVAEAVKAAEADFKAAEAAVWDTLVRTERDRLEFIGQLIDVFEDFLEQKGIDIPNSEKEDDDDIDNIAILYGSDYGQLSDELEAVLRNWGILGETAVESVCWKRHVTKSGKHWYKCPCCGHVNEARTAFCPGCGKKLN